MLFIQNKYHDWYYSIINRAQTRASSREEAKSILGYVESHHVIPKTLGGDNSIENRAYLTAREHFICHYLLTKFTQGKNRYRMLAAINGMQRARSYQLRYINSRLYETAKKEFSKIQSLMLLGSKQTPEFIEKRIAPLRGKKQDPEVVAQRALKATGKKRTKEQCQTMSQAQRDSGRKPLDSLTEDEKRIVFNKISTALIGIPKSEIHKKAISKGLVGKTKGIEKSEITKQRMRKPKSEDHKNSMRKPKVRICRIHDQREMSVNQFSRWVKTLN